ncbi:MAG: hypothetical protein JRI46_02155 [Deltaproteobacteria bacterium]|nr:hypothetical protein [Deltaproteobacteria bacterium]
MAFQMKKRREMILGAILGLLIFLLPFPSHSQGGGQGFVPLRKVAVLPFLIIRPAEGETMAKGLWGEFFFRAGEVPSRAGSEVMAILYRQLFHLGRCEVTPLGQAMAAVEGVDPIVLRQDPLGEAVRLGRQLGVYAVVIGGVYRFEQRQGSALGVERPASVAFDAHLVRLKDKKVIWSGRFDETQRSLSENLLKASTFVKAGGRWVTVEKLTAIGVESVLRTFPSLTL